MWDRKRVGKIGERAALRFMRRKGYRLLRRNWRYSRAEIDLIFKRGEDLIFAEVKSRFGDGPFAPETQLKEDQMGRIVFAAQAFMDACAHSGGLRFDLIAVDVRSPGECCIRHYEDAFFPGLDIPDYGSNQE